MIEFVLERRSRVATYMQLVLQVKQALRVGLLRPGDQLPRVREVAQALAVNPNTVHKAYRELEVEGLAEGRPGVGTFVVKTLAGPSQVNPDYVNFYPSSELTASVFAPGLSPTFSHQPIAQGSLRTLHSVK